MARQHPPVLHHEVLRIGYGKPGSKEMRYALSIVPESREMPRPTSAAAARGHGHSGATVPSPEKSVP